MPETVVVGMSGGVDSSVTAALLREQGYNVIGVTLNLWPERGGDAFQARDDACCALGAVEDARRVADRLDIPYYVLNFRQFFEEKVISNFAEEYAAGRTPNPCIRCNQFVKFDALLERALQWGADFMATGHYARIARDPETGRWLLRKALDGSKDQSYVLYMLRQDQLARTLLPLGSLTKEETRRIAADRGLVVATKPDSQEVCFVPKTGYRQYLAEREPATVRPGPIVDSAGRKMGEHPGIGHFTVGQRKGLGLANGHPLFVLEIRSHDNAVVVGKDHELYASECIADNVNFIPFDKLEEPILVAVRVRYRSPETAALVYPEDGGVRVKFLIPQRAVAPGQAIVFYQDDLVVGGGTVRRVWRQVQSSERDSDSEHAENQASQVAHSVWRGEPCPR